MLWHLCDPQGVSVRTAYADDVHEASRRLAPVAYGCFVCSDASYRMGWVRSQAPELCVKCFRNAPAAGSKKCEGCRKRDRGTSRTCNAKRAERSTEKRRETNTANGRRATQGNILRGIAYRRAKQEATA